MSYWTAVCVSSALLTTECEGTCSSWLVKQFWTEQWLISWLTIQLMFNASMTTRLHSERSWAMMLRVCTSVQHHSLMSSTLNYIRLFTDGSICTPPPNPLLYLGLGQAQYYMRHYIFIFIAVWSLRQIVCAKPFMHNEHYIFTDLRYSVRILFRSHSKESIEQRSEWLFLCVCCSVVRYHQ